MYKAKKARTRRDQHYIKVLCDRDLKASNMKVCRICLATDVKLHSLQFTHLGTCMKSVAGLIETCEGLPNYVCYQCAPILLKCGQLIAKSKTAQAALLDIFYKNGRVTKSLLKERNRSHMNLESSLSSYVLLNYDYIQYHSDVDAPELIQTETVRDMKNETVKTGINHIKTETVKTEEEKVESYSLEEVSHKAELDNSIEEMQVETPVIQVTDVVPHMLNENLQECTTRISSNDQPPNRPHKPRRSRNKAKKRKLKENAGSVRVGKNRSKNTKSVRVGKNRSNNTKSASDADNCSKNPEVDKWSELRGIERNFKFFRIPVTKSLLKERNRSHMNLESSLSSYVLLNYDYIQYHSDVDAPELIQTETVRDMKNETVKTGINHIKTETVKTEGKKVESYSLEEVSHKAELDNSIEEMQVETPVIQVTDVVPHMPNENLLKCTTRKSSNDQPTNRPNKPKRSRNKAKKRKLKENAGSGRVGKNWSNTKSVGKNRTNNTKSVSDADNCSKNPEVDKWSELRGIERDFKVFRIPYIERHTIWRSTQECIQAGSELLCSICGKSFSNADLLQAHSDLHNPSIRGKITCVVCLVCFSTSDALKYHVETIHGNRFYCKTCPMAFNNLEDAKCHRDLCLGAIARGPNGNSTRRGRRSRY